MLHYGDVEDDVDNPPIETLQEKSELKAGPGSEPELPFSHAPPSPPQFPWQISKAC